MEYLLKGLRTFFCCGQDDAAHYWDHQDPGDPYRRRSATSSHSYSPLPHYDDVAQFRQPKPIHPWSYQSSSSPAISTLFRPPLPESAAEKPPQNLPKSVPAPKPSPAATSSRSDGVAQFDIPKPSQPSNYYGRSSPSPLPVIEKPPQSLPNSTPVSKPSRSAPPAGQLNYQKSSLVNQIWVDSSKNSKEKLQGTVVPPPPIHLPKESDKKLPDKQPAAAKLAGSHSASSVAVKYVIKEQRRDPEIVGSQSLLVDRPGGGSRSSLGSDVTSESRKKKSPLPVYQIPEHLEDLFKKDKVPEVLCRPLSPATYADYFAALLYAEDYHCKKWSNFILKDVTLELQQHPNADKSRKNKTGNETVQKGKKDLVAFMIDSVPERRPYLLSRDFVHLKPSGRKCEPFQGDLVRVVKSTTVLVEFGDDFHAQHSPTKKYDVSFSFNRVCLKRAHHAVVAAAVLDACLRNILFPNSTPRRFRPDENLNLMSPIISIANLKGPLPYLIEGPPLEIPPHYEHLSATGVVIVQAIFRIYRTTKNCRILIAAPRNTTCDALTTRLYKEIPKSEVCRTNAAFRDFEAVPDDVLPSCLYEGECFVCPNLSELESFKVVTSTFMSSFRLRIAGIGADHFTHIFLVDASSSTEPETVVALANLVGEETRIVVTGSSKDSPLYLRSNIARRNGLRMSYFHRLLSREPYLSNDPMFITHLEKADS